MQVLVCGGLGFIGLNFVLLLAKERPDWAITVLDKQTYAANELRHLEPYRHVSFVKGDLCNGDLVNELVSKSDAVVNFAAETHNDNSISNPVLFFETNLMGVLTLAEACRRHQTRLHQVSTDEVYGDTPVDNRSKFTEKSPYRPSSPYSSSKASADLLLRSWHRTFGLRITISNCTNNFGKFQHSEKLIPSTIRRISRGNNPQIYGDGSNVRDWIHVIDHCRGVLLALEKGTLGETYLFGANCEVSNLRLAQALLNVSGRNDLEVEFVEDRPGHDERYALDSRKARVELGWEPREDTVLNSLNELFTFYASGRPR